MQFEIEQMQLKEAKKDLTEEFQILRVVFLTAVKAVLLSGGYSEAKLDTIGQQWLEQVLEDDALTNTA